MLDVNSPSEIIDWKNKWIQWCKIRQTSWLLLYFFLFLLRVEATHRIVQNVNSVLIKLSYIQTIEYYDAQLRWLEMEKYWREVDMGSYLRRVYVARNSSTNQLRLDRKYWCNTSRYWIMPEIFLGQRQRPLRNFHYFNITNDNRAKRNKSKEEGSRWNIVIKVTVRFFLRNTRILRDSLRLRFVVVVVDLTPPVLYAITGISWNY